MRRWDWQAVAGPLFPVEFFSFKIQSLKNPPSGGCHLFKKADS
jgi:hypothetical protein